jgi:hypothetical protein
MRIKTLAKQRPIATYFGLATSLSESIIWKAIFATALWVIVGVIAVTHRKSLMRRRLQARAISG